MPTCTESFEDIARQKHEVRGLAKEFVHDIGVRMSVDN